MSDQARTIEILMYHSVSDAGGPTSIPAPIFEAQIEALASAGYHVADLTDVKHWQEGKKDLPAKTAIITFDDGFKDFETTAWPTLKKHGFPAIVFLPTDRIGADENWAGANDPARPLMDWDTIRALHQDGASFGSHTLTHAELPAIDAKTLEKELIQSRQRLEEELGAPAPTIAPPYGATSEDVRTAIARHYDLAVGTGFDRATEESDLFDLPRIEMFYFQNISIWRRYLEGKAELYLTLRKVARGARRLLAAG